MPDHPQACKPLDVVQLGRRFALQSDEELENRVLRNKGIAALEFASKIVARPANGSAWDVFDFGRAHVSGNAQDLADAVEKDGKFGLVVNFRVHEPFKQAAIEDEKNFKEMVTMEEVKWVKGSGVMGL